MMAAPKKEKKKPEARKRLVLLDSHAILHRAYHALPDFSTSKGEPTGALYGLVSMIMSIVSDVKPDYIAACFDLPKPTHRHELYEDYKSGRKKTDTELVDQINRSREVFAAFSIPIYENEGFEADDMLGTIVERLKNNPEIEIVIASGDMDTLQLVEGDQVKVFTLRRGLKDTILYDEKAVFTRFGFGPKQIPDYKGLAGDPSDNIVGVPGIGEKTATELIKTFGTVEGIYEALEKKGEAYLIEKGVKARVAGLLKEHREEAEFSKMLATIRRDAPLSFEIPEKPWKQTVSVDAAQALFDKLEFRSMMNRFKNLLNDGVVTNAPQEEEKKEVKIYNPEDAAKLKIAYWLLRSDQTNPELEDALRFAKTDDITEAIRILEVELDKKGLTRVYTDIEVPLIPVITRMEARGIKVDRAYLADLSKEFHAKIKTLETEIFTQAGEEFNVASPKQLGEILFVKLGLKAKNQKKTQGGALSTKESELEKLRDIHPIISHILEHREFSKLIGTYVDAIPPLLDANDRLHTTLIQTGTTTGRMASEKPNVQNIPIKTETGRRIRRAFIAEKGFKLLSLDYSQIELRIAAFLSKDEKLLDIFREGKDIHRSVAAQMFGKSEEEVTQDERRAAKTINFGVMYGMGVNALRENLGTDRKTAQDFYNNYFNTFTKLAQYLENMKVYANTYGYTETFFGRRRYFAGLASPLSYIRASAERMAINAPIQGTEADIVKLAMIEIDKYLEEEKLRDVAHLLLQVHDEILLEVRADKAEEIAKQAEDIMESILSPEQTEGVPISVDYHIGDTWAK